MAELVIAGLVFLAAHVLPTATGLRAAAVARLGRPVYLGLYSLLSIALLAWVVRAAGDAPYIEIWPPSAAGAGAALILMAIACWLLVGAVRRPNPASISFRQGAADPADPGPLALTRHPLLWSFALWAAAHVLANGDAAALLMFGAALVFALLGMRALDRRAARDGRVSMEAPAPSGLAKRAAGAFSGTGWIDLLAAALLFAALLALHPIVIGVDPLGWVL